MRDKYVDIQDNYANIPTCNMIILICKKIAIRSVLFNFFKNIKHRPHVTSNMLGATYIC